MMVLVADDSGMFTFAWSFGPQFTGSTRGARKEAASGANKSAGSASLAP